MSKILGILILILAILFFPPSILALISNNAVPGDVSYPVKVKLEEGIVFLTSFNSNTKIWFSVTRSDRRFQEASILLNRGQAASQILTELVTQTDIAAGEISQITDQNQKQEFIANLQESIQKYDDGLVAVQERQQIAQITPPPPLTPTPIPSLLPTSTPAPTVQPTTLPKSTPLPTPTPSPKIQLTVTPAPTTPVPTVLPTPRTAVAPTKVKNNEEEIKKAREKLEEIKNKLKKAQENTILLQKKENQNHQNNIKQNSRPSSSEQPANKDQSTDNYPSKK